MTHIKKEMLQAYIKGVLSEQEEIEVMEHIAGCDDCATCFADLMSKERLVSPPPDLQREILGRTVYRINPVKAVQRIQERKRERQRELLAYSVRMVFAMAASILIVFTMSAGNGGRQKELPAKVVSVRQQEKPDSGRKSSISGSLQRASGKMGDALQGFLTIFDGQNEEERD